MYISICHRVKLGGKKTERQMLSINPHPPTRGREKEEKGERLTN